MRHSTTTPTKAEAARFAKLKALGCIACRLNGDFSETAEPEIHHFLSGNRRIGHEATVPLCTFHHRGIAYDGVPEAWFLANVGPSWHLHRREFRARYGTDWELLQTVNELIGEAP